MKNLFGLIAVSFLSLNVSAGEIAFTSAEFTITKVKPMCPPPKPGQMTCMALGGTVTVSATIGCLDKMIFSHFELADVTLVPTIRAVSVVRADSDSTRVMCTRINTVVKEVQVPTLHGKSVSIINETIHQ